MKTLLNVIFVCALAAVALPSEARPRFDDWMVIPNADRLSIMIPPEDRPVPDDLQTALSDAAKGSFAAEIAKTSVTTTPAASGWVRTPWHQRSPLAMYEPPAAGLLDMISPIANSGAITGFGPRVSPVPEPSAYVMLIAGLTAVGFIARRRSKR